MRSLRMVKQSSNTCQITRLKHQLRPSRSCKIIARIRIRIPEFKQETRSKLWFRSNNRRRKCRNLRLSKRILRWQITSRQLKSLILKPRSKRRNQVNQMPSNSRILPTALAFTSRHLSRLFRSKRRRFKSRLKRRRIPNNLNLRASKTFKTCSLFLKLKVPLNYHNLLLNLHSSLTTRILLISTSARYYKSSITWSQWERQLQIFNRGKWNHQLSSFLSWKKSWKRLKTWHSLLKSIDSYKRNGKRSQ